MKFFASVSAVLALSAVSGFAQTTTPPTTPAVPTPDVTMPDSVWSSPAVGTVYNTEVIPIYGQATDPTSTTTTTGTAGAALVASGIARVEYRLSGQAWKKLMLVTPGDAKTVFFGSFKLGKGKSTRFSIRTFDRSGNEGLTYTQIVKRSTVTRKYQAG